MLPDRHATGKPALRDWLAIDVTNGGPAGAVIQHAARACRGCGRKPTHPLACAKRVFSVVDASKVLVGMDEGSQDG